MHPDPENPGRLAILVGVADGLEARKNGGRGGPLIDGVTLNGRLAIFFSPLDIATGFADVHTDGFVGYKPEAATRILINLLDHVGIDK